MPYNWLVPVGTFSLLAVVELIWLLAMHAFYKTRFQNLQPFRGDSSLLVSVWAAVLVYLLLAVVVYVLIIHPIAMGARPGFAVKYALEAVLLGAAIYGTYNLTNKATLVNYSWAMVFVDTIYGTCLFLSVYAIAVWMSSLGPFRWQRA